MEFHIEKMKILRPRSLCNESVKLDLETERLKDCSKTMLQMIKTRNTGERRHHIIRMACMGKNTMMIYSIHLETFEMLWK